MKRSRKDRIDSFEEFYNTAKETFNSFQKNDQKAQEFENLYMLCVCPGSRNGGSNNRIVEVFWGSRAYETIAKGKLWTSLAEYGATLHFERSDTGHVTVFLNPAGTKNLKQIESSIILKHWFDPIRLKDHKFLKGLWNDFMAYMECTSLDSKPSFSQRLRILWLRFFRHLVIDSKWMPKKSSLFIKDVLKWVFTVGLSGAIILVITLWTKPSTTQSEIDLKEINKNLDTISKQLKKISGDSIR